MTKSSRPRYFELLRLLTEHEVEFIVVGGVAAILSGAPITTLDLDVVCSRAPRNLKRLLDVLGQIQASYRDPAGRHIVPDLDRLQSLKMNLLKTTLGPFDVLTQLVGESYEELVESSSFRRVGPLDIRVLSLEKVIKSKEIANRDKDRAVLPVLRKTLEVSRKH